MVSGRFKSKTFRKVRVKVPGNTIKMHFKRKKPAKAVCAVYGTPLSGVARGLPLQLRKMPKTAKRPQRPFGGVLSSKAMRDKMKAKAKAIKL